MHALCHGPSTLSLSLRGRCSTDSPPMDEVLRSQKARRHGQPPSHPTPPSPSSPLIARPHSSPQIARAPAQVKSRRPPLPAGARKRKLEVTSGGPPPVTRLSTPECVSSPVSHLRNLTKDLDEGARRERAAQYLRETREQHLQQRRLYLVLDLDETLVHSLRQTVRPLHRARLAAAAAAAAAGGEWRDGWRRRGGGGGGGGGGGRGGPPARGRGGAGDADRAERAV